MNHIIFGTKNSYNDWGLTLKTRPVVSPPNPIYEKVQIKGRDGALDLTEALDGEVHYEDRKITAEFNVIDAVKTWDEKISKILNYLQGQKMKITLSSDEDYYYLGRCKINDFTSNKKIGKLVIECEVEPYKYKQNVTVDSRSVSSGNSYTYTNDRKSVIPIITNSADMTLEYNGNAYTISAGTNKILDIKFIEGNNTIAVTNGSGTLKLEYQEASL